MFRKDFDRIRNDAQALRRFASRRDVNVHHLSDNEVIDYVNDSVCENGKFVDIHTSACMICSTFEK